ncbi:exosortase E/protease, VPEID-CTERM system [Phaeobacter sp.]|uniref:exosortase E/protease, VPEID-CTERM system n=1 Tax=Phaeobacter sp. TaxID=1902409 RepID=UPI0025CE19B9|nr:exosortase E/protease, VPEID-CTERM system [Phaeobacter sp.]
MAPAPQVTGNGSRRFFSILALLGGELLAVMVAYQLLADVQCNLTVANSTCTAVRSIAGRLISAIALMGVFLVLVPSAWQRLRDLIAKHPVRKGALAVNAVGVILLFAPLAAFGPNGINAWIYPTLILVVLGGGLAGFGASLALLPLRQWGHWLWASGPAAAIAVIAAIVLPDLAKSIEPLWNIEALTSLTFFLVATALEAIGASVWTNPAEHLIRVDDFLVQIGEPCSGVEGFALISVFMALYSALMGRSIRQSRYWLFLFPAALIISWAFNILRISGLILIGAWVAPEHAVNGFHSYAGWLLFTLLALAVLMVAHRMPWLQVETQAADTQVPPMRQDFLLASIVPFIVMMLSGVMTSALWADPADGYPLRSALMAAAVLFFLPAIWSGLRYRPRSIDIAAGAGIGAVWVTAAAAELGNGLAQDPQSAFWISTRLLGSVLLVPIVEELFFRGYLLKRLAGNQSNILRTLAGLLVTSALFGLMHDDRFVLGMVSGIIFGALFLRGGGLGAAVVAHIVANLTIAYFAYAKGFWALL